MARLIYTRRALEDLERLADFLRASDPGAAATTMDLILEGLSILRHHPLMGRPATDTLRELILSRGKTGYVALYSHEPGPDAVLILAIRHQRESGYAEFR